METIAFLILAVLAGIAASELRGLAPVVRPVPRRRLGPRRAAPGAQPAPEWSRGLARCATCP
jgi:hypothetical protein